MASQKKKALSLPPGPTAALYQGRSRKSAPAVMQTLQNDIKTEGRPPLVKLWDAPKNGVKMGELKGPKDVSFYGNGRIAVSESTNGRVQLFDSLKGVPEDILNFENDPGLMRPCGINLSKDHEIILTADMNQVHLLNPMTRSCAGCCVFPKDLYGVHGVCGDWNDNIIITNLSLRSKSSAAIYNLDNLQKPLRKLKGDFGEPRFVVMDYDNGQLYISDSTKHCVHVFDKRGQKLIRQMGNKDSSPLSEKLLWPMGMCVTQEGHLLVADKAHNRVYAYDKTGAFLYHLFTEEDGVNGPVSIATNDNGLFALVEETLDYGKDKFSLSMYRDITHLT